MTRKFSELEIGALRSKLDEQAKTNEDLSKSIEQSQGREETAMQRGFEKWKMEGIMVCLEFGRKY